MCSPSFLGEHSVSYRAPPCRRQCCEDAGGGLGSVWQGMGPWQEVSFPSPAQLGIAQCEPKQCLDVFGKRGPKEPRGTCLGCRKERGIGIMSDCTECLGLDLAAKTAGIVLGPWHVVTVLPHLWLPSVSGSLFLSRRVSLL